MLFGRRTRHVRTAEFQEEREREGLEPALASWRHAAVGRGLQDALRLQVASERLLHDTHTCVDEEKGGGGRVPAHGWRWERGCGGCLRWVCWDARSWTDQTPGMVCLESRRLTLGMAGTRASSSPRFTRFWEFGAPRFWRRAPRTGRVAFPRPGRAPGGTPLLLLPHPRP